MVARNVGFVGPSVATQIASQQPGMKPHNFQPAPVQRILYKMRGYNSSTLSFEYWHTYSPQSSPPSGNALTNVAIAAILIDAKTF